MALGARLQCATSRPANPHAMQNTATRPTGYSPPTHRWHVPPSASRHPHTSHLVAVDDARDRFDLVGLRHAERRGLSLETCELCGLVVLIVLVAPPPVPGRGFQRRPAPLRRSRFPLVSLHVERRQLAAFKVELLGLDSLQPVTAVAATGHAHRAGHAAGRAPPQLGRPGHARPPIAVPVGLVGRCNAAALHEIWLVDHVTPRVRLVGPCLVRGAGLSILLPLAGSDGGRRSFKRSRSVRRGARSPRGIGLDRTALRVF